MTRYPFLAFATLAFVAFALPVSAQIKVPGVSLPSGSLSGGPVKSLLGHASDSALDKLAKPGAFSADSAIRIGLPGAGGALGGVMKMAGNSGITDSLNNAAGQAASAAKPIFHAAIDRMSVQDMAEIATGGNTGATQYLRKSAGGEINTELTPLVRTALEKTGVLSQASSLSSLGLTSDSLINYVTQKTADGIFTYMGREETSMRQNPMSLGKGF
jgi:hypothetical protein